MTDKMEADNSQIKIDNNNSEYDNNEADINQVQIKEIKEQIKSGDEIPLLASRGVVVFPYMVIPLLVGREKSVNALKEAMNTDEKVFIITQKDETVEEPAAEDLYSVGTIAEVRQMVKLPNNMLKVIVEGLQRARVQEFTRTEKYFATKIELFPEKDEEIKIEDQALMRTVLDEFQEYVKYNNNIPAETMMAVVNIDEPGRLADIISSNLELKFKEEQKLLEAVDSRKRLHKLLKILQKEIEVFKIEQQINKKVRKQVEETQKEYYLKEKLKVIREELGEDEENSEIHEYQEKMEKLQLPVQVKKKIDKEINKLEKTSSMSPEATVIRNYLDCVLDLPWDKSRQDEIVIKEARKILDEDHYGLQDIKERILEYLAVRKLAPAKKSPILCFVGAPGVGKTSLGRSIARALKKDFVRLSLGGVRDEAEIRGHRRTYIGSRPGRIINAMLDAGSNNPVFLMDEVDKMSADFRGDPAAALLEVLDPEQNSEFTDHYLELPFDLSRVLFITTANVTGPMPPPLLDRMEVIELPGYTEDEKVEIAERHLLPRILQEHGLTEKKIQISTNAIYRIIREYTREAGVRNLERKMASIVRKVIKEIVEGRNKKARVSVNSLNKYLGVPDFKYEESKKEDRIGVATGMAYNEAGGDILDIEVAVVPGKGEIILTGSLGDVMKESARAALSYIRSKQKQLGLSGNFHENYDIHIHVPQGAVPKDGPSAGITIGLAVASALTERPVRGDWAMTGEISLRGRVLPVGGIKTKILAARRAGLSKFILPEENEKNLEEISSKIKRDLKIEFVSHMDEVLKLLLMKGSKNED